jgi:hypothetical protein
LKEVTCFNWNNFEKLTELMNDVFEMDLELINLIDHDTTKIYQHRIPQVFKPDNVEISEDNETGNFYWN